MRPWFRPFLLCLFWGCTTNDVPDAHRSLEAPARSTSVTTEEEVVKKRIQEHNQAMLEMDRLRDEDRISPMQTSQPTFVFTLTDGSVLKGQLLDLQDSHFQVRSSHMGMLSLPLNRVVQMKRPHWEPAGQPATTPSLSASEETRLGDLQRSLGTTPALLSEISQLQSNPALQSVLLDSEILHLLQQRDLEALQRNPKIQQLMQNPEIQQLLTEIAPQR